MKSSSFIVATAALTVLDCVYAKPLTVPLEARRTSRKTPLLGKRSGVKTSMSIGDWATTADLQWYATISVGTPPQKFTVLLDTGSADIYLPQNNCTTCPNHNLFSPHASSTFSSTPGYEDNLPFSTGIDDTTNTYTVNGSVVTDAISVNGITVPAQMFLLADAYGSQLAEAPFDGLMGLPPAAVSNIIPNNTAVPWTWQAYKQGVLDSPSFGLWLGDESVSPVSPGGELTLGGYDTSRIKGDIEYVPLNPQVFSLNHEWSVNTSALYLNGKTTDFISSGDIAVLDSGTSYIQVPDKATAAKLYAAISPKIRQIDPLGAWGAECDVIEKLDPEITFMLPGANDKPVKVTIPKGAFNLGPYKNMTNICETVFLNPVESIAEKYGVNINLWVIGGPLLKGYYTVWDVMDLKVGFATLNTDSATNTTLVPISSTLGLGLTTPTTTPSSLGTSEAEKQLRVKSGIIAAGLMVCGLAAVL